MHRCHPSSSLLNQLLGVRRILSQLPGSRKAWEPYKALITLLLRDQLAPAHESLNHCFTFGLTMKGEPGRTEHTSFMWNPQAMHESESSTRLASQTPLGLHCQGNGAWLHRRGASSQAGLGSCNRPCHTSISKVKPKVCMCEMISLRTIISCQGTKFKKLDQVATQAPNFLHVLPI